MLLLALAAQAALAAVSAAAMVVEEASVEAASEVIAEVSVGEEASATKAVVVAFKAPMLLSVHRVVLVVGVVMEVGMVADSKMEIPGATAMATEMAIAVAEVVEVVADMSYPLDRS